MELRQESLFADETKGGIEVIYSKFIDQRRMDYKASPPASPPRRSRMPSR